MREHRSDAEVDSLPQSPTYMLVRGESQVPDAERHEAGIRAALAKANRLFFEEPRYAQDGEVVGKNSLIVSESAKEKESPLDAARMCLQQAVETYGSLAEALWGHPQREQILRGVQMEMGDLRTRLALAEKTSWWGERLSAFAYGGVWNPEADALRK